MVQRSCKLVLIEGPNLNLVKKRSEVYQSKNSLQTIIKKIETFASIEYFQSNIEGEIINKLHAIQEDLSIDGVIINPAGYTHYSVAIMDALEMIKQLKLEVHLSNIYAREAFRRESITAKQVHAVISGAGNYGYYLAAQYILEHLESK